MNQAAKTYLRDFLLAMLAYTILLPVSILILQQMPFAPGRFLVSLLPMIPIGFGLSAFLRYFERMDELQKKIQLFAFAFAGASTAMLTFTYGLLENAGFPHLSFIWVLPILIFSWGIGTAIASRRYA